MFGFHKQSFKDFMIIWISPKSGSISLSWYFFLRRRKSYNFKLLWNRPAYLSEIPDEILKMLAYDGKTDLISQYHDQSGFAKNPTWFPTFTEDYIERVSNNIKDGKSKYPQHILKAIEDYLLGNVSFWN